MAYAPSISEQTYDPDQLIASDASIASQNVTIVSGAGALVRGTLLGKIKSATATPTAGGGNTGDGTIGAVTTGEDVQVGTYTLTCIEAAANAGRFQLADPDGEALADVLVGVAYTSDHLNFTVSDGAADFIVGDSFTIAVAAGSGKYTTSLAAAVDGSEDPVGILVDDVDASLADKVAGMYTRGDFVESKVTFGTGHTADSTRDALRDLGIYLKPAVPA